MKPGSVAALLLCALCAPMAFANSDDNVLVIYSDDRMLPANQELDRAFNESLAASAPRHVDVYSEFLDRARISSAGYEGTLLQYLREKYAVQPPAVIVAGGTYALQFLLQQHPFPGVPVVSVGVTKNLLRAMHPLPGNVVSIPIEYDSVGTIERALKFHPGTKRIVIITGADANDPTIERDLRGSLAPLGERYTLEFLAGLPTTAVLRRVAALPPHSIVFTPGYFTDGAGRHFSPRQAVSEIVGVANAPVYGPYNTFLGTGIVGGVMPSFADCGKEAAAAVVSLLDGVPPARVVTPAKTPATLQVDWRQVQRWGIDGTQIPADAIQFRTPTFWEAYGWIVLIGAAIIALQAALIAALLYERRLQRRTAAALAASERRMVLAARTAQVSNWVWNLSSDAAANGSEASQLYAPLSKEPPVVPFARVLEVTHPADRQALENAVRRAVDRDEEFNAEYRVVLRGGTRWLRARGRVEPNDPSRMRGVAIDVTQGKEAQLQAEQDRTALGYMTRVSLLGQLSAAIAHQLNQPLAAILSNAEAARKLLQRDALDRDELNEIVGDVIAEDQRAAAVIRRLRALYQNGAREMRPLDLNDLVRETLGLLESDLVSRQVIVTTELAPSLPTIEGERVQLQQVFMNLIVNGTDAMEESPDGQHRQLTIRTRATEAGVEIDVEDRGRGIAAQDLEHVFDMFFTTKRGGMGVGLAICRSIVAAHRGSLTAHNNPEGGSTFTIRIPTRQA